MNELKTTYLVDTENINTCWINIFKNMNKQDRMLLFYTENTPYLSYEYMDDLFELERRPEMIRCKTGRNALDFQLVSHLGYLIHNDKSQSYVIVTKDKAYRVVAEYWTDKGFQVACCTPEQIEKQMKKSSAVTGSRVPLAKQEDDRKEKIKVSDAVVQETKEHQTPPVSHEGKKGSVMELLGLGRKKKKDSKKESKKDNKKEAAKKEAGKKVSGKKKNSNEQVLKSLVEKQTKQTVKQEQPKKEKSKNIRAELGNIIPKELKKEDKKLLADLESFIKENGTLDLAEMNQKFIERWGQEKGDTLYQLLKDQMGKLIS